jgi:maleylacetoacetate isomerase/maleylpyruvate isomerase
MKLYTYFQSGGAYRVRIALNLKGLKAEMIPVNLVKSEHKTSGYEAINPQQLVPTFIDGEHTLSQSLAIMEYLEETYPTPSLLPKDSFARAYVRSLALVIACDTSPLGNLSVRKYLGERMGLEKEQVDIWMQYWIAAGLASFERTLASRKREGFFCFGDTPTMADCCLMPQVFNAHRWKCDLAPYPRILKIAHACDKHPAFIAAHPSKQADAA